MKISITEKEIMIDCRILSALFCPFQEWGKVGFKKLDLEHPPRRCDFLINDSRQYKRKRGAFKCFI